MAGGDQGEHLALAGGQHRPVGFVCTGCASGAWATRAVSSDFISKRPRSVGRSTVDRARRLAIVAGQMTVGRLEIAQRLDLPRWRIEAPRQLRGDPQVLERQVVARPGTERGRRQPGRSGPVNGATLPTSHPRLGETVERVFRSVAVPIAANTFARQHIDIAQNSSNGTGQDRALPLPPRSIAIRSAARSRSRVSDVQLGERVTPQRCAAGSTHVAAELPATNCCWTFPARATTSGSACTAASG